MNKTIRSTHSGHTLCISPAKMGDGHPADIGKYKKFYTVRNWDKEGVIFFYVATGYEVNGKPCKEIHVWYRNGKMWSSFGKNMQEAIEGAQKDGWMYAEK